MGNILFVTTEDRADKLKDADYLLPPNNPLNPMFPGLAASCPRLRRRRRSARATAGRTANNSRAWRGR
jgi:hypothetical protein